jgi:pimeloyl-ACP methyl ester carboxylesterase
VVGLIRELHLVRPPLVGYGIGSRIAQSIAADYPELLVRALVLAPPLPVGRRILDSEVQQQYRYQAFHQLDLAAHLLDVKPEAIRDYLRHLWSHWSGPSFTLDEEQLEHLVSVYGAPGAFTASIGRYRAGAGAVAVSLRESPPEPADRIGVATTVLWPDHDPRRHRPERLKTGAYCRRLDAAPSKACARRACDMDV